MFGLKYIHFTIIYILFISVISHMPNNNLPESSYSFSNQDKIFHFTEFFILGVLIQLSFIERKIFSRSQTIFMTLICGCSIACMKTIKFGT